VERLTNSDGIDLKGSVPISGSETSQPAVSDTSVPEKLKKEVQKQEKENEKELKKKEIDTQKK